VNLLGKKGMEILVKAGHILNLGRPSTKVKGAQSKQELKLVGQVTLPLTLVGEGREATTRVTFLGTNDWEGETLLCWPLLSSWFINILGTPHGTQVSFGRGDWKSLTLADKGVQNSHEVLRISPRVDDSGPLGPDLQALITRQQLDELKRLPVFSSLTEVVVAHHDPMQKIRGVKKFPVLLVVRAKLASPLFQALDQATSLPVLCRGKMLCVAMKMGSPAAAEVFRKAVHLSTPQIVTRLLTICSDEEARQTADAIAGYWVDAFQPKNIFWNSRGGQR